MSDDSGIEIGADLMWADDQQPLLAALGELVVDRLEADTVGLSIAAPSAVVATARDRLPIVGVYTASARQAKVDDLRNQLLLVASCVETRALVAATAFEPRAALSEPLADDDDPGEGMVGVKLVFDAFARLELPREPGTWIVRLLLRDRWSNAVTIRFGGDPVGYRDEEVERFLAAQEQEVCPTKLWPPQGELENTLPAYGDDAIEAPEPPLELGFELAAPRVFVRDGSACVLNGSFRLQARTRDTVDFDVWREANRARGHEWQAMTPNAVLPVSLLITGSQFAGPRIIELALPSYDPLGTERTLDDGSDIYTGRFAIDLERIAGLLGEPQTNFIYAFCGETWAGPCVVGLVTPSMLPRARR